MFPDEVRTLRLQIDRNVHGFVVYIMVVDEEFMKAEKTETPLSKRMAGTFSALRNKMGSRVDHPTYQEKPSRNTPSHHSSRPIHRST